MTGEAEHLDNYEGSNNSMDRWGGIPRYLVSMLSESEQNHLESAIYKSNIKLIVDSLKGLNPHPSVSHKLIHIVADEDTLEKTGFEWASVYVEQQTMLQASEKESLAVKMVIKSAGGIPEIAGFRGNLFEPLCHCALMKGGRFEIRNLENNSRGYVEFPSCAGKFAIFNDLAQVSNERDSFYWRPASKCLPSVDAILHPNILLQVTVSVEHPVKADGLLLAMRALRNPKHARLYFVVPEDTFGSFTKQPITGYSRCSAQQKKRLGSVTQFALKLNVLS